MSAKNVIKSVEPIGEKKIDNSEPKGEPIKNNHEILFIYDATMCNPNGDPDNENKPRMDNDRQRNIVTDVRLKRYIRDYFLLKGKEIFVAKSEGESTTHKTRLEKIFSNGNRTMTLEGKKIKLSEPDVNFLVQQLIDVRLFGAIIPDTVFPTGGNAIFTGPVQFNWGYSLNEVTLMETNGITSHFTSGDSKQQGAMGKDYRVNYSLIAFHGIISAKRAEIVGLSEKDILDLDAAMINAIPLLATRSKIGQYPKLYIRIEYNTNDFFIGDLRRFVKIIESSKSIRSTSDFKLDLTAMWTKLIENNNKIHSISIWQSQDLELTETSKTMDRKIIETKIKSAIEGEKKEEIIENTK